MAGDDDQRALIAQLTAALAAQAEQGRQLQLALARIAPMPAQPAPVRTCDKLLERWRDAHKDLGSFACDYARGLRLMDWAPKDGPFAGIRLGDRDPATLTGEDLDAYRVWRGATVTRRKGPPTVATTNRELMMLRRPLNFAVSRNTIPRNPIRGIEDEDEDNAREVVVEEDGFALIVDALGGDARMHQLLRAFVTLAYDSGMRKTELLLCRWSWLDTKRGMIHIPGAVAKNGHKRIADLSSRAWAEVDAMDRVLGTDLLFANPETREPYDGRWIHELFVAAVRLSGVVGRDGTPPRLHDLRRSWITLARRRGVPESEIMKKSGHSDHKVFRRYSIVDEDDLRTSWQQMEDGRQRELAALAEKRKQPQRAVTGVVTSATPSARPVRR